MHTSFTKRLAALMLALVLSLSLLPMTALAAEETVTVQLFVDTTSIAEPEALATLGIPAVMEAPKSITVPAGTTVKGAMGQLKELTVVEKDNMVTTINGIGDIAALCDAVGVTAGNLYYPGWMYTVNGATPDVSYGEKVLSNGDSIVFRYTTYSAYPECYDWQVVDAYHALCATMSVAEGKGLAAGPTYLAAKALTDQLWADNLNGIWLVFFAARGVSMTDNRDALVSANAALQTAVDTGVDQIVPTKITVPTDTVEIPMGGTYQLKPNVIPAEASQEFNYVMTYPLSQPENVFTVSATGLITPKALSDLCMVTVQAENNPSINSTFKFKVVSAPPVPAPVEKIPLLLEKIPAGYKESDNEWIVMDMGAYRLYNPATTSTLSAAAVQTYLNTAIATVSKKTPSDADLAKAIVVLRSLGYNPQQLFTAGNKIPINAVELLKKTTTNNIYTAPYVLLAYAQGDYAAITHIQELLNFVLNERDENQVWNSAYGDDCTGMVLQGLAPFANDAHPEVQAAVQTAVTYLSTIQKDNGAFSGWGGTASPDSTAEVILGLSALGIDTTKDSRFIKKGKSALDAMLSYGKEDGSGFDGPGNDAMTTERCFRALLAAVQCKDTAGFNVYNFISLPLNPAVATGNSGETPTPPPVQPTTMTLRFTLKGDEVHGETAHSGSYPTWISGYSVRVPADATVAYAVSAALKAQGFAFDESGLNGGYLKWIESPNTGTRLAEFSNGPLSGWKYQVNGQAPTVGIANYVPENGDSILLYFTDNYTVEPDAEQWTPGGIAPKPEKPDGGTLAPTVTTDQNGSASVSVSREDSDAALEAVKKNGSAELVIAPNIKGDASKVQVTLPKAAVSGLANETTAALTVESKLAKISLSTAALTTLAAQSGGNVSITAEKISTQDMSAENKALVGDHPVYNFSVSVGATAVREFGGKVTVKLPYTLKEGENGENITIFYMDQDGKATEMAGAKYDAATKSIVFETNHFSTFAVVYHETKATFTDVTPGDWFAPAVDFVTGKKLFAGTAATTFSPAANMNRAMLWTVLYRMDGLPKKTDNATWYADAQNWAIEEKISDGTKPAAAITRQELVAMLYRYAAIKKYDMTAVPALTAYEDAEMVSDWAKTPMAWGVGAGIITGRSQTTLAPADTASRGEVAVMVQRFLAVAGQ